MIRGFGLVLSVVLFVSTAFAQVTVKDKMQEIGGLFKTISQTMGDATQNAVNAQNAQKLADAFVATSSLVPPSIAQMSGEEQKAAMAEYQDLLAEAASISLELKKAFETGAPVQQMVQALLAIRKEAHAQFML
ncbi:MAG: RebB family R body protein [Bdellovibrionales bacterium]|nr:RebB family R body protein [Bdellovibrionales bacterium]